MTAFPIEANTKQVRVREIADAAALSRVINDAVQPAQHRRQLQGHHLRHALAEPCSVEAQRASRAASPSRF